MKDRKNRTLVKPSVPIPNPQSPIPNPSSRISHPSSLPLPDDIYTAEWKGRIHDYFSRGAQFAAAWGYWAFDFERQWAKHRRAVARELRLVERLGHWMPPLGRRVLVMGSWLGAEAIAYALCGAEVTAIDLDGEALRPTRSAARRSRPSIWTARPCVFRPRWPPAMARRSKRPSWMPPRRRCPPAASTW